MELSLLLLRSLFPDVIVVFCGARRSDSHGVGLSCTTEEGRGDRDARSDGKKRRRMRCRYSNTTQQTHIIIIMMIIRRRDTK